MKSHWRHSLSSALLIVAASALALSFSFADSVAQVNPDNPEIQTPPWAPGSFRTGSSDWSFAPIARKVTPAVVNIASTRIIRTRQRLPSIFDRDPFFRYFGIQPRAVPQERRERSLGSGVIVSENGVVLTNNHVIEGATEVQVYCPDGSEHIAQVLGTDPHTDVAVLKIEGEGFPTVPFADSEDVEVGDVVLAVGNPFGIGQTVTMGIISAVGKANVGVADYEDFIQTDAAINPGNSGGALINIRGELIGINTAIFSRTGGYQGIGFAIPSAMAKRVMTSILSTGFVERGWIGVNAQNNTPEIAEALSLSRGDGALISEVNPKGPGSRSGLRRGDLIVSFDGQPIGDVRELDRRVALAPIGKQATLGVMRGNEQLEFAVSVEQRAEQLEFVMDSESWKSPLEGVVVENLDRQTARRLNLQVQAQGVVVVDIIPNSPASLSALAVDDVILEINRQTITDVDEFRRMAEGLVGKVMIILVARGGRLFYLTL